MDESPGGPVGSQSHKPERSNISDYSLDSTPTIVASPTSPLHHRPGYHRISSLAEEDTAYRGAKAASSPSNNQERIPREGSHEHGLAIENVHTQSRTSIPRVGISPATPATPASIDPLLSPSSSRTGGDFRGMKSHFEDDEEDQPDLRHGRSNTSLFEPFTADSEHETLHKKTPSGSTGPSGPGPGFGSRPTDALMHGRWSAIYITLFVLTIYSTVLSGLWLGVALHKPRFGRHITTNGKIPPATASLLCTAIAKTIELSFVTVFVALIGQVLSRRAFNGESKGFTIAELSMRTWVMQPGTMITHWLTVRNAGFSILGAISLAAALMAMLYTTASDALVTPKLKYGNVESRLLYGKVATSWANPGYIKDQCKTPIQADTPDNRGTACIDVEHAGQAYHNYLQFLSKWTDTAAQGNNSKDLNDRPEPTGMLYDNTTVHGSWINVKDMTEVSVQYNRTINNVSMAMPHTGVFAAARDSLNNILQPQDLDGLGEYQIRASVPSPFTNVLCAEMSKEELDPMVYTSWPMYNDTPVNMTFWPDKYNIPTAAPDSWLNKTSVDDVFGFGEKYNRRHPVFPKLPLPFNTILNTTRSLYVDSIYLLLTSPQSTYMLCSIRGSQTPNCSTEYRASMIGGTLSSHCDDPTDDLAYRKSNDTVKYAAWNGDYTNVAVDWATALSLNDGTLDANASNARILSQLIPTTEDASSAALDPALPSIAEAVAVLAGCTLLMSSLDSPYVHYWNYSSHVLSDPQYQSFRAEVSTQDYSSGGTERWQNVFYIVLAVIFATNLLCLYCLLRYEGLVTDFIEPQNLFGLSLNSPPSRTLGENFGGSPGEEQLQTSWFIKMEKERETLYIEEGESRHRKKKPKPLEYEMDSSPVANMYSKLATKRTSIL